MNRLTGYSDDELKDIVFVSNEIVQENPDTLPGYYAFKLFLLHGIIDAKRELMRRENDK
jgi:hypothetical protein